MKLSDYNGKKPDKFLKFKYAFWATGFIAAIEAIEGYKYTDFIKQFKGFGWKWLGY